MVDRDPRGRRLDDEAPPVSAKHGKSDDGSATGISIDVECRQETGVVVLVYRQTCSRSKVCPSTNFGYAIIKCSSSFVWFGYYRH